MYCNDIKEISSYVKVWIQNQPTVKEESITDWLLYEISRKIPYVKYISFTRSDEARKTGADWEWWFVFDKGNYRLRVQAKKGADDNYPSIAYTNKYGLQIDKLLSDAEKNNAIPFYAFYTDQVDQIMCIYSKAQDEGVFLSSAYRLYTDFIENGKRRVKIDEILLRSNPITCFFCCDLILKGDTPEDGFRRFINKYYLSKVFTEKYNNLGYHAQLPQNIRILLNSTSIDVSQWYEKEYRQQIQDIDAIVIVDMRER